MGRPFRDDLSELQATFHNALARDLSKAALVVQGLGSRPLIAVGSGGSVCAAEFAARWHEAASGALAKAVTPLELVTTNVDLREAAVIIFTAGGSNPDVLAAVRFLKEREIDASVWCARRGSKVAHLATGARTITVVNCDLKGAKDGFLATNSLLQFAVLIVRCYTSADTRPLSTHDWPLISTHLFPKKDVLKRIGALLRRDTVICLHSTAFRPAAVDLESKFTEAALGHIQLADFRNFAHGRHHWIAKRSASSAVITLSHPGEADLVEETLAQIPKSVLRHSIVCCDDNARGQLEALLGVFGLTHQAGAIAGHDPGKPGVPTFGRKIYHAGTLAKLVLRRTPKNVSDAAVERKSGRSIGALVLSGAIGVWRRDFDTFCERLKAATYGAVVLDYDGTLCDKNTRAEGLQAAMAVELERLLGLGLHVGVATGRGGSVSRHLRALIAKRYWPRITVGCLNGGHISQLDNQTKPPVTIDECFEPTRLIVSELLAANPSPIHQEARGRQITLRPQNPGEMQKLYETVAMGLCGRAKVSCSQHSIDIISTDVSKVSVAKHIQDFMPIGREILSIGDCGRWPGNDYELLNNPFGLSVDAVSENPQACWNIAPLGRHGIDACMDYLSWLRKPAGRGVMIRLPWAVSTKGKAQ